MALRVVIYIGHSHCEGEQHTYMIKAVFSAYLLIFKAVFNKNQAKEPVVHLLCSDSGAKIRHFFSFWIICVHTVTVPDIQSSTNKLGQKSFTVQLST